MRRHPAIFVLALAAAASGLSASTRGQTFKATTELVTIPLTVTDRRAERYVRGLGPGDFRVTEDGIEQTVTMVDAARQPISLCIVIDRSRSVEGTRQEAAEALVDLVLEQLPADDEISLVTFGFGASIALDWGRADTRVRVAWKEVPIGGGVSALADALALTIHHLDRASRARRAVLVLSDGRESGSVTSIRKLATTRRQSETELYAFGLDIISPAYPANMRYLQGLVGDSGGYVHVVRRKEDLPAAVHDLLAELANQYLLGFVPTRPFDGKYRRVKVEGRDPALKVRHRGGYLAVP